MSTQSKLSRKVFSIVIASGLGVAALASPSVETKPGPTLSRPTLAYKLARADKPPPGGDKSAENIKKLCALLGVGEQFHSAAPTSCGVANLGDLAPNATVCATPPPDNTLLTEGRNCEVCAPLEFQQKCKKSITVTAKVKASITLPIYGYTIACNGMVEYSATAASQVDVQNTTWKPVMGGMGTDEAVDYISSLTRSTVSSKASLSLSAGCTANAGPITAEIAAELALACELEESVTFGAKDKRDKKTCGDTPEPCASELDTESAVAAPCPEPTLDDAGAPVVDDPVVDADAAAPEPTPTPEAIDMDAGAL